MSDSDPKDKSSTSFEQQAEQRQPSFLAEFWDFLIHNKKWWLTPIILVLLLFGLLVILSSSPISAPFIYPLW